MKCLGSIELAANRLEWLLFRCDVLRNMAMNLGHVSRLNKTHDREALDILSSDAVIDFMPPEFNIQRNEITIELKMIYTKRDS
jgi:hypothetical protein